MEFFAYGDATVSRVHGKHPLEQAHRGHDRNTVRQRLLVGRIRRWHIRVRRRRFLGSTGSIRLQSTRCGMASTPSANGYWLVAADGGIFAYGDAGFYGSSGVIRRRPRHRHDRDAVGLGLFPLPMPAVPSRHSATRRFFLIDFVQHCDSDGIVACLHHPALAHPALERRKAGRPTVEGMKSPSLSTAVTRRWQTLLGWRSKACPTK